MKAKNYVVFQNNTPADVNVVGIRANSHENVFDDIICVFFENEGRDNVLYFRATTDPGLYWLENPITESGTAILKPDQYRGAFRIGKHKGKYPALVQNSPLTVFRDYNRDHVLDFDTPQETGMFGINIHCAMHKGKSIEVDKWSAGCQVIADWYEFMIFMAIMKKARSVYGNSFTYTLLTEEDIVRGH